MDSELEPVQLDRDAAADLMEAIAEVDGIPASFDALRRGEEDLHFAVQAFCRHRITAAGEAID